MDPVIEHWTANASPNLTQLPPPKGPWSLASAAQQVTSASAKPRTVTSTAYPACMALVLCGDDIGRDADGVLVPRAGAVCSELCRPGLLDEWEIPLEQPSVFIKSQTSVGSELGCNASGVGTNCHFCGFKAFASCPSTRNASSAPALPTHYHSGETSDVASGLRMEVCLGTTPYG